MKPLHYVNGSDQQYIDGVDVAYFTGHRCNQWIVLSGVLETVPYIDCNWGDYDLEWIFLHGCHTTEDPNIFKMPVPYRTMNGVHLICGFVTESWDLNDGENLAHKLLNGETVVDAWFNATDMTHDPPIVLRVIGENEACKNDHIWGSGTVISDPPVDQYYWIWDYDCQYREEGKKMKKEVILAGVAIVALGLIVTGVGLTCLQQAAPGTPILDIPSIPNILGPSGPYILAAPFPDVNDSYPVYRTVLPDTSAEEKRRIGDLFGVSGDGKKPERTEGRLNYYTNSGAFQYIIPAKAYPYATHRQPDLPSDEKARAIATDYLKEHGLLSGDIHATGVSVGSSFVDGSAAPGGAEYILTKLVIFVEEIEGLPVQNAGIGVAIGENGEVVAVSYSLRKFDPKPVRKVKIVTPEQAYQQLSAGDVMIQPLPEDYDKIMVTNISLGYWMETQTEPQEYIVPVYVFSCTAVWDGKSEEVFRYVQAVDPSEVQDLT